MKKLLPILSVLFFLGSAHALATESYFAFIEQSGAIPCSKDANVSCELSCVAWLRQGQEGRLVFGNDKTPKSPAESAAFSIPYSGGVLNAADAPRTYFNFPPFSTVSKLEAMSVTPDGSHALAMTAMDRYNEGDSDLDKFSALIAWPSQSAEKARVVSASQRDGIVSSRGLRSRLAKAIQKKFGDKATYFKVEGLALLPGNRAIFGIREIGQNYGTFEYRVVLIQGGYAIVNGEFTIRDSVELEVVRDFSDVSDIVGRKVGVSSIEYDTFNKRLVVLTSFEENEDKRLGAYLWILPDENGLGTELKLVRTTDGAPFEFSHKAEGLAILDQDRIFVIHDNDRYLTRVRIDTAQGGQNRLRRGNEAPFEILRLCTTPTCQN